MKIKYIFVMLLIFGCAIQSIEAEDAITNLGTMDYEETKEIDIDGEGMISLSYITSDFDKKTLSYSIINYNNNTTTYEFSSNTINIFPYTFEPEIKNYYFYDTNSGSIYKIAIDFSDVAVPNNPYIQQIETLQNATDEKNERILSLQENLSSAEAEIVEQKNKTKNTQQEVVNLSGQLSNLQQEYTSLEEERDQLKDELEGWPYIATVIVLVMSLIIFVFVHMLLKKRFQKKSDITIENDTNYTPLTRKFDAFAKKFFRKEADKTKRGKTLDIQHINEQIDQPKPVAQTQQPLQQEVVRRHPITMTRPQEIPKDKEKQTVIQRDNTKDIVDGFKKELFSKIDELNDRVDRAESRQRGSD